MVNFHQQLKISDDALLQAIDDEMVLLNMATNAYYHLDSVGARILTLLSQNYALAKIFSILLEEYDVDPEPLRQDIQNLVEDLLHQGLVEVV